MILTWTILHYIRLAKNAFHIHGTHEGTRLIQKQFSVCSLATTQHIKGTSAIIHLAKKY
jgi:hypothetical protein